MRWLDSNTNLMDMNSRKLEDSGRHRSLTCYSPWDCRVIHVLATEQQCPIFMFYTGMVMQKGMIIPSIYLGIDI